MKVEVTKEQIHFTPQNENDIFLIRYMSARNPNTVKFESITNEPTKIKYITFDIKDVINALRNNNIK